MHKYPKKFIFIKDFRLSMIYCKFPSSRLSIICLCLNEKKPHVLSSKLGWKWFSPLHLQWKRRIYFRSCLGLANNAYILIAKQYLAAIIKEWRKICTFFFTKSQDSHYVTQRWRCLYLAKWTQKDHKTAKNNKK